MDSVLQRISNYADIILFMFFMISAIIMIVVKKDAKKVMIPYKLLWYSVSMWVLLRGGTFGYTNLPKYVTYFMS